MSIQVVIVDALENIVLQWLCKHNLSWYVMVLSGYHTTYMSYYLDFLFLSFSVLISDSSLFTICFFLLFLHSSFLLSSDYFIGLAGSDRMATNLEYSGIFLNMENSWNSWGILCNLREN